MIITKPNEATEDFRKVQEEEPLPAAPTPPQTGDGFGADDWSHGPRRKFEPSPNTPEILQFICSSFSEGRTYEQISREVWAVYKVRKSANACRKARKRALAERAERRAEKVGENVEAVVKTDADRLNLLIREMQLLFARTTAPRVQLAIVDQIRKLIETKARVAAGLPLLSEDLTNANELLNAALDKLDEQAKDDPSEESSEES